MTPYPKQILTVDELLKTYADAGMEISDCTVARDILLEIGYYRLRGYSFHLYNHDTKQYKPGTSLEYILSLYRFDSELRNLIFSMTGEIEVTLRTRFCEVLLQSGDPLIYLDAAAFQDKELFWKITAHYHRKLHVQGTLSLNIITKSRRTDSLMGSS